MSKSKIVFYLFLYFQHKAKKNDLTIKHRFYGAPQLQKDSSNPETCDGEAVGLLH